MSEHQFTDLLLEASPGTPPQESFTDLLLAPEQPASQPQGQRTFDPAKAKDDPSKSASAGDIAIASFASDENEAVRFFASKLYPEEPIDQAAQRFVPGPGGLFHQADDGFFYPVVPGGNEPSALVKQVLGGVGTALPAAAGAAAGIVTAPLAATGIGLAGTLAATGGAAAAGEFARQKIGDVLMGEASTEETNLGRVATEGVIGAAGQGIGAGIGAFAGRNLARDINLFDPQATAAAAARGRQFGVSLTPAETSNLPSLKAGQKRLGNITETQNQAQVFYDKRNQEVFRAWDTFLDDISKVGDADESARLVRSAAQETIEAAKQVRRDLADPVYKRAWANSDPVDVQPVIDLIDDEINVAKGGVKSVLKRARSFLFQSVKEIDDKGNVVARDVIDDRLQPLHGAKVAITDMLKSAGQTGTGPTAKNKLTKVWDLLNNTLKKSSDTYREATSIWDESSTPIDELVESSIQVLADLKDTNLQRAALSILNPTTRSPGAVTRARKALEGKSPKAWQALKRSFLQDVASRAFRVVEQGGEVLNPAGKLVRTLSNQPMKNSLKAAMTKKEFARFEKFMLTMRDASRVKQLGSDTEFNRLASEEAIAEGRTLVAKIARNSNPAQLLRSVDEFLTNRNVDKNAKAMADVVFSSEPDAVQLLKQLRIQKPGSTRWRILFGHMISRGAFAGVEEFLSPSEPELNPTS